MSKPLPTHLDPRVRGLRDSATIAINERSNALLDAGRDIYKLGLGQSPFPVPAPVVEVLRAHAHEKDYLPVRGLAPLRAAVADFHRRREGIDCAAEDVLIGPGSKELIFLLQLVYGADLLIPAPSWVSYAPQATMLGRYVHHIPTSAETGWRLQPERLDEALRQLAKQHPGRARLLILNYPCNPTGTSLGPDALRAIAAVARRHQLLVLSDEIYGELHHRGQHVSIARDYPEGTIIAAGLSKWCGAGGWRLGSMVFPRSMRWLLDAMASAASETYTSASAPIQYAAVRAFRGGPEIDRYVEDSRAVVAALGSWMAARLNAASLACPEPDGGFYLFVSFEPHRARLHASDIHDSKALCERILIDTGVAILPAVDFGRPDRELICRLAYVDFDGASALTAAAAVRASNGDGADSADTLDEAFLRRHCPRVCEATERLIHWVAKPGA